MRASGQKLVKFCTLTHTHTHTHTRARAAKLVVEIMLISVTSAVFVCDPVSNVFILSLPHSVIISAVFV